MSIKLDRAIVKARELGKDAGEDAASWVFDGNTDTDSYRTFLRWYDDGDPRIDEFAPRAWLSGEWADDVTPDGLAGDVDMEGVNEWQHAELALAYEDAANDAYWSELQRVANLHTS